jgi:hypothetical protein
VRNFLLALSVCVSALVVAFILPVFALDQDQEPIAVTVTPKLVAISVSPTTVSYGTVSLGVGKTAPSDSITVTNSGNVAEDFDIEGDNASTAGGMWSLVSGSGSPGANQFKHSFNLGPSYDDPFTALTSGFSNFVDDVAASGTQDFKLKIEMPSSTSVYGQYTTKVELLATEHGI